MSAPEITPASEEAYAPDGIAIIGMAGRFPGASDIATFWTRICDGESGLSRFAEGELEDAFTPAERADADYVPVRGVLGGVEDFDAAAFKMRPREAALTDPQHRVFLELAWEALEDAGYPPLAGHERSIGVFAGCSLNTYLIHHVCGEAGASARFASEFQVGSYETLIGGIGDSLATRVSYKLDLRGPSMTISTACSTSLTAIAQAVQALLLQQCDMALAGGVSITFPQRRGYVGQDGGIVSTDGVCRPFDADANGTVFGSGAGAVLLKRLEDAIADGDHVYAVIKGAAVNNDGASKVGFAAPSVEAQAEVIATAHALAGIEPSSIGFVECHGTATPLGDPIEVAALSRAFGSVDGEARCLIGSVKGNVGHLDAAAGVTGLIKAALSVERATIPGTAHFRAANPLLQLETTPFAVSGALSPWPRIDGPRRAGVSALGVGGTNVHVVLEQAPARQEGRAESGPARSELLVLSARSPASLDAAASALADHLETHRDLPLADVAHTLRTGRARFDHRAAFVCRDRDEAIEALRAKNAIRDRCSGESPVIFMFPGQGAQRPGMGRELREREAVYREVIEAGIAALPASLGAEVDAFLLGQVPSGSEAQIPTRIAQPAIFLTEYALAQLWMSRGIRPAAMLGHSVGELVAATLAGVMTFDDALGFVADRGRMMGEVPGGAMLAVRLPEAELTRYLEAGLDIAAVNAPRLCVAAGSFEAVEALERRLSSQDVPNRRLHTSHAFHSAMMEAVVQPLTERAGAIRFSPPEIPYVSGVSGDWITAEEACDPAYWARHCRESVRFADALGAAVRAEPAILLEVGPGRTLSTFAAALPSGAARVVVTSMPDAGDPRDEEAVLAEAVGRLWTVGIEPDWDRIGTPDRRCRVSLPPTPFDRQRHWIEPAARTATAPDDTVQPDVVIATAAPLQQGESLIMPAQTIESSTIADSAAASLRSELVDMIEELSGTRVPDGALDRSFLDHGLDSLFLAQFVTQIRKTFGVKLTFRQLLGDLPSVAALSDHIAAVRPAPAPSPTVAAPLAVAPGQTMVTPTSAPAVALAPPPAMPMVAARGAASDLHTLLRDQLAAMNQIIAQQCSLLGSGDVTLMASGAPLAAPAQVAAPQPAPVAASNSNFTHAPAPPASATEPPARHHLYRPDQNQVGELTPAQARFVDDLIKRYNALTPGSKTRAQNYRSVLADPRTAAGFRLEWKDLVYPLVCESSKGARIRDIDGNEFIDLVNGFGQTAFGHSPDFVVKAVTEQLEAGFAIGPQTPLAGEAAALVAELTGSERVTFCNTGSEAVMAAMRVARTVTGRDRVVTFAGDYHGQFDEVLIKAPGRSGVAGALPVASGIPRASVGNMVVLPYLDPESLAWIRDNASDIAAVVVEPVQSRHPGVDPGDFLRELRMVTEATDVALVFDEVITGFRVHPGGMQALLGIRADLVTYGKVVGGGMPVGILAGKARFMDALDGGAWRYGDDSVPEVAPTFFAGTFVRHPLVLAAVRAVLLHIKEQGGALQEELSTRAAQHVDRLNRELSQRGIGARIERFSSWYYIDLSRADRLSSLLFPHMRALGIHVIETFPCFLTTAHTDADLERVADAFAKTLDALQAVGILQPDTVPSGVPAATAGLPSEVPLTEAQREVWLAAQLGDEASCAFNESVSLRLDGPLDREALGGALNDVVGRHDALRGRFSRDGASMLVDESMTLPLPFADLAGRESAALDLAALVEEDACTPFDLAAGPLVRATLVRLGPTAHVVLFTAHHIVCDGWSANVIMGELGACYAARRTGQRHALPDAPSFRRYGLELADTQGNDVPEFWRREFETLPEPLDLPTDRPRAAQRSFHGATFTSTIDAGLTRSLKAAAAREGCTLFSVLLASVQALFGRLADHGDVVLAVPSAGQGQLDEQALVGHCVNFLPIRVPFQRDEPFRDHLARAKLKTLEAFENQETTLGTLVRCLNVPRELNRLPLTSLQFNLERLNDKLDFHDLTASFAANPKSFTNYDIFLNATESDDGLRLDCDYSTDLFDEATIGRWLGHLQTLLGAVARDMTRSIASLELLSPAELRWLTNDLNRAPNVVSDGATLHQLVAEQARRNPHAVAVTCGDESRTYGELEARADVIARQIADRVTVTGGRIALATRRSADMVAAMIGIMRAGHAYVPLDLAHPPARSRRIVEAAKAALVICDGPDGAALAVDGTEILNLDEPASPGAAVVMPVRGDETPAYVMFTSGSTGEPKGVEVGHRSVVNLLRSMAVEPGFTDGDTLLAVTTTTFDISVLELFLPLISGGRVVIADRDEVQGGFGLVGRIESSGATVMQATPTLWRILLEAGFKPRPGLRMFCGGEPLPRELADRLLETDAELWNLYGPTETTIWSSVARVMKGELGPIVIGEPVANTQLYVLGREQELQPPGVIGDLFIGGTGLAHGYVDRPDLTAAAFREIAIPEIGSCRLYRTGDTARRRSDGSIELLGRADQQIKLRGFRIELGEIEAVLRAYPGVKASAVSLVRRGEDVSSLVGYYVDEDGSVRSADLAAFAAARLPDYMVPGLWQRLEALPQTLNGKLDRKRLPEPDPAAHTDRVVREPRTPQEAQIAEIWRSVLKIDRIGIDDNIFSLGADSIHVFRIAARLMDQEIRLEAKHLLKYPTIAELASVAAEAASSDLAAIPSLQDFRRPRQYVNGAAR